METDIFALDTVKGGCRILVDPDPKDLSSLRFDEGSAWKQQKHIEDKRRLIEMASEKRDRVVLAVTDENRGIAGFAILGQPEAEDRWAALGGNRIAELKSVEVAREYRNIGIARCLLWHLFSAPHVEDKLAYLVGYSWDWDHDYLNMSVQSYRRMLVKLYGRFGFRETPTNEPNVCLKPENLFMVRAGKNVNADTLEAFKWIRFGIYSKNL